MSDTYDIRTKATVLIVDDEEDLAKVYARGLERGGYRVSTASSSWEALRLLESRPFDVLLTDIHMPRMRGDELQRLARNLVPDLAVLLVTAAMEINCAVECLKDGVFDYMVKPVPLADLVVRVDKAIERRQLVIDNREYRLNLERKVAEQTEHIKLVYEGALQALIQTLEAKDEGTRNHSNRVVEMALRIAQRLRPNDTEFASQIKVGALFHDIGKIGVSEAILNKPGRLTPEERAEINRHPEIGETILQSIFFNSPEILKIVRNHHEQIDGGGYPDRLFGDEISLGARIVAAVDAFDAMTHDRPYRKSMPMPEVVRILREGSGSQWDEEVISALLQVAGRISEMENAGHAGEPTLVGTLELSRAA